MKRVGDFLVVALLGIVVLLGIFAVVLILSWTPLWSEKAAGWAQAIGAIVAILVAYNLGMRQSQDALNNMVSAQRLEVAGRRAAALAIADAAVNEVRRLRQEYSLSQAGKLNLSYGYNKRIFTGFIDALASVPLLEIRDQGGVAGVVAMKNAMVHLQDEIEAFIAKPIPAGVSLYPPMPNTEEPLHLSTQIKEVEQAFRWIEMALEDDHDFYMRSTV